MPAAMLAHALLLTSLATAPPSPPAWTQWGGPDRNFSVERAVSDRLPALIWERTLGSGHSGVVSDGQTLYTHFGEEAKEYVVAVDPESGETVWQTEYAVRTQSSGSNAGPHATPLLAGNLLVTVAVDGQVRAWEKATGAPVWRRDLVREFRTSLPQFGYAASPLRWGDSVILPGLGGRAAAAIALNLADGRTIWARHAFLSSHASPIVIRHGGRDHAVFHGMNRLVGLDPANGGLLWSIRLREDAIDNVAFSPVWDATKSLVLVSHGYDRNGLRAVRIERGPGGWTASEVWKNGRVKIEHGNAVVSGDLVYGSQGGFLCAVDVSSGRTRFKQRGFPEARVVGLGARLLVLGEDGRLALVRPGDDGVAVVWSTDVLAAESWTAPTVAGDRLILRDRRSLKAFRLEE